MLNTCDNHDDCIVVHDTKMCPVCELQTKANDSEAKVTDLLQQLKEV